MVQTEQTTREETPGQENRTEWAKRGRIYASRIEALRAAMKERGITCYLVPTADDHESEYSGEHFKCREFLCGFTGSAGILVVTDREAGLWTDGRYFIQAERELTGSGVVLYRMGEPKVPTVKEFAEAHLKEREDAVLGFCGRTMNTASYLEYASLCLRLGRKLLSTGLDLAGELWGADRPPLSAKAAFFLEERYSGESISSKLERIREKMKSLGADVHVVASLDDVNYLLNTRGSDAGDFRVAVGYLVISNTRAVAYFQKGVLDAVLITEYAKAGVEVKEYEEIYRDLSRPELFAGPSEDPGKMSILMDSRSVNSELYDRIPYGTVILDLPNPSSLMKAVKNPTEQKNIREAHLKDAVSMTEFLYWLKTTIGREPMTEWTASEYIDRARSRQEGFLGLSFETISAYNANAAMMHYSATKESAAPLAPSGMLLVDSGGHYLEGTTDITRTIALGEVPEEWKKAFTLTLKGNLQLAGARFLSGATGPMLDVLARGPLWQEGIDYKCGTGHGVGYALSVHEGPNAFRPRATVFEQRTWVREKGEDPYRNAALFAPWSPFTDPCILQEGMVTTDEPGVYREGEFGIRIENELLCRKDICNENGQFLSFEQLTFVPIDRELIDPAYLEERDLRALNEYHQAVWDKVSVRISDPKIREWLRQATLPIGNVE